MISDYTRRISRPVGKDDGARVPLQLEAPDHWYPVHRRVRPGIVRVVPGQSTYARRVTLDA